MERQDLTSLPPDPADAENRPAPLGRARSEGFILGSVITWALAVFFTNFLPLPHESFGAVLLISAAFALGGVVNSRWVRPPR